MNRRLRIALYAWIAPCLLAISAAAAPAYVAVDLFTIQGPGDSTMFTIGGQNGGIPIDGGQVVGGLGFGSDAGFWASPSGTFVDLHPDGYAFSGAEATDGIHQVGYAYTSDMKQHAMLWSGTAASAVDLHPNALGYSGSYAVGVGGNQQVGEAFGADLVPHALLWGGTAGSAVDLTPTLFGRIGYTPGSIDNSSAVATDGVQQVGFVNRTVGLDAFNAPIIETHPVVWSGTAASAVDLNPAGYISAVVLGVGGGQQVGTGVAGGTSQALLWTGTAASVVNLAPSNIGPFDTTFAIGTNGLQQVGGALSVNEGIRHAVVWSGTAGSAIDLHPYLPNEFYASTAYSIDAQGNIFGFAQELSLGLLSPYHAIEWVPVPEPASLTLAAIGAVALVSYRGRIRK